MIFNEKAVQAYDEWLRSPAGYYIAGRKQKLILDLLALREGETVLDVGCGTGQFLMVFRRHGCEVAGIDPSPAMIDLARKKLGHRADLYRGDLHDLPFSDNDFDVVSIITSLEFCENPENVIAEAFRVARNRIVIGFINRYSPAMGHRKEDPIVRHALRAFGIWEMKRLVTTAFTSMHVLWGSVIFLPFRCYPSFSAVEERIPSIRNPLGLFGACLFPVVYTHHTIQHPLKSSLAVDVRNGRHVPGTAREMKR
jgi:ubiquinone/menaquinone biosynthesis C-methylase UbiE